MPDRSENLAALGAAFLGDSANQSLGASGFQRLPSGLVMQWGAVSTPSANTLYPVTPTVPFSAVLRVFTTGNNTNSQNAVATSARITGATTFSVTSGAASTQVDWFAIGLT